MAASEGPAGTGLLRQAVDDALASAALATPALLTAATPCSGWDLRELLRHLSDSLAVLREALTCGRVSPSPAPRRPAQPGDGPVAGLGERAAELLTACAPTAGASPVSVAGHSMTRSMVAGAGAVEVAVHGWDIRMACGDPRPVPTALALELLPLALLLVPARTRPGLFAGPVPVPRLACPGDHLVAFLGRSPARWRPLR